MIGLTIVHEARPPERFDAPELIQFTHDVARTLGFEKVRVDKGVSDEDYSYEVNYGCGTVRIRFERRRPILHIGVDQEAQMWEVSRENYRPERCAELVEMLEVRA